MSKLFEYYWFSEDFSNILCCRWLDYGSRCNRWQSIMAIDCSKEETWKSFCRSESWKWPEREQGRDSSQSSCSPGSTLQKSFTSWTWTWDWESIPLMGRLVCAIQSNWIKSKPTVLVQHIGYLSSHPRKLMMIKYEFSSSPQCSWGSRSDVSSTKWGSAHTSPPRHTPCHVARGK